MAKLYSSLSIQRLTQKWFSLKQMAEQRKDNLDSAQDIQRFHRLVMCCSLEVYMIRSYEGTVDKNRSERDLRSCEVT